MGYLRVILLVSGIVVEGICGAAAVRQGKQERREGRAGGIAGFIFQKDPLGREHRGSLYTGSLLFANNTRSLLERRYLSFLR